MANTVATVDFQNLHKNHVIDANYDREKAFWRAIKVFLVAYTGYEQYCRILYTQKLIEYIDGMKDLYSWDPDMNKFPQQLQQVHDQIDLEAVDVVIGIKKARGLFKTSGLKIVLTVGNDVSNEMPLKIYSEVQTHKCTKRFPYDQFRAMKEQNIEIRYSLVANDWADFGGQLNDFSIGFREISAEGFEDWFTFGRGVSMLIKIEIVALEPNPDPEYQTQVSSFHLHTIYYMLELKYKAFNNERSTIDKLHRPTANKVKMSYIRKRVNPNSEQAFWSTTSFQNIMQSIRTQIVEKDGNYSQMRALLGKPVKYMDAHISLYFEEEYEDVVCLCSQWCNWNAFFHFNPMFRSLLVNHNQLYLLGKTNVSDMYLFCAVSVINLVEQQQQQPKLPQPLAKAPVFQLMAHANTIRRQNYITYYMKKRKWRTIYRNSKPPFEHINGMAYKFLRESKIIADIILQSSTDPFADICLENIINFYDVLSDLHTLVSLVYYYVPRDQQSLWFKELNRISRENYYSYIRKSYQTRIRDKRPGYDFLFSEDYEFSNVFIRSEDQRKIKKIKEKVYKFAEPQNPLNILVTLDPLTATLASIYKVLTKIDPMLSAPHSTKAITDIHIFCKRFDDHFSDYSKNNKLGFYTDLEAMVNNPTQMAVFKHYYVFYTLKLYSMAFGVQKYCISSLIQFNEYLSVDYEKQVSTHFDFIWNYELIEQKFRDTFAEELFTIPHDIALNIEDFYDNFWGLAQHEANHANTNYQECTNSGFFQYQRLYFWWNNGGDDRLKFRRIIDVFDENLVAVGNTTEQIYSTYILVSIVSIQEYEYHLEVFDVLVYDLVKAYCSMVFNIVAAFFLPLNDLQFDILITNGVCYTLTKPGWVSLFKTMNRIWHHFHHIKQYFIVFDDENDRISKAISQTRDLIKGMYKDFYDKLLIEWRTEMDKIWNMNFVYQPATYFLSMHLANGLSFLSAFIDEFRFSANNHRKEVLLSVRCNPTNPQIAQQVIFKQCYAGCYHFLKNPNSIREARPFLAPMWQALLGPLLQAFPATAQQVHLDMNEADQFI